MNKVVKVIISILTFGIYAFIDRRRQDLREKICNNKSSCRDCAWADNCTMVKEVKV